MNAKARLGMSLPLLAGAIWMAGCACPVAEREIVGESIGTTCPGVYRTRIVRRLEPVGESFLIQRRAACVTAPGNRTYNPVTRSWERPWPYGPYDTANWW